MNSERGRVLVTGGAGFIGSHVVDVLLSEGYAVRVLDALLPQVHERFPPEYLNPAAEYRVGDLRDSTTVRESLDDVDVVVHLAAAVGVGQSMYEIEHYCSVNVMGTATLLQALVRERGRVRRVVVASSMSLYGEGLFHCDQCGPQSPQPRPPEQLSRRDWSVRCPRCDASMRPLPTPESKPLIPTSIYAVNKRDHEEMVLVTCRSLGIAGIALRFFNVYGARQALSNPYTGVAAIFSSALLNGEAPVVFEDGLQSRDFVHVGDIARACVLAVGRDDVRDGVFNVGTGRATDLLQLFRLLREQIPGSHGVEPQVLGRFREGDIRSCYADISQVQDALGFAPRVALEQGVEELARWVASQTSRNRVRDALQELERHGLVR